jgi:Fur family peroxide stress response transcriptional regulator
MSVSVSEVERRASVFVQTLRANGLRVTHQRLEVGREIARSEAHPDVEAIYLGVRERMPTISLDTVYRTLAEFEQLGLVKRVNMMPGPTRYDANQSRHHHFVCERCGLVRDVYGDHLDSIGAPGQVASLGRVEAVAVRFHGVCKECAPREENHE